MKRQRSKSKGLPKLRVVTNEMRRFKSRLQRQRKCGSESLPVESHETNPTDREKGLSRR